jgi:hypothetical protein
MTRSIIAIATAVLAAATMLTSAAEAGFGMRIGFGGGPAPYLTDYNKESAHGYKPAKKRATRAARRQVKAPVKVTKKATSTHSVAKIEETAPTADTENSSIAATQTAETENSSISVAQVEAKQETLAEPVETAEATPSEPLAARQIDCKKFFATVGMTLTVPCE